MPCVVVVMLVWQRSVPSYARVCKVLLGENSSMPEFEEQERHLLMPWRTTLWMRTTCVPQSRSCSPFKVS